MGGMPLAYQVQYPLNDQMRAQADLTRMQTAAAAMNQSFSGANAYNLQNAYTYNGQVHPRPALRPSVASTAASRVQKSDWEIRADQREREVDDMIERHRQERERVRIEEDGNVVEDEKHSEASSGSVGYDGGNEG